MCRESVCVVCVCLCHCVSRVINTVTGAVTRAEKVHKFPQAERDTLGLDQLGMTRKLSLTDLSGANS